MAAKKPVTKKTVTKTEQKSKPLDEVRRGHVIEVALTRAQRQFFERLWDAYKFVYNEYLENFYISAPKEVVKSIDALNKAFKLQSEAKDRKQKLELKTKVREAQNDLRAVMRAKGNKKIQGEIREAMKEARLSVTPKMKELCADHRIVATPLHKSVRRAELAIKSFLSNSHWKFPRPKNSHTPMKMQLTASGSGYHMVPGQLRVFPTKLGWIMLKEKQRWPNGLVNEIYVHSKGIGIGTRWYVSLSMTIKKKDLKRKPIKQSKCLGIDFGLTTNAMIFDGKKHRKISGYKHLDASLEDLRKIQRKVRLRDKDKAERKDSLEADSNPQYTMKKNSKRYKKLQNKVGMLHLRVANQRKDVHHKLTTKIARVAKYVGINSVNPKQMQTRWGRRSSDLAIGMFKEQMSYKLADRGGHIFVAGCKYWGEKKNKCLAGKKKTCLHPQFCSTTQTCWKCGNKADPALKLGDKRWVCTSCKTVHDREKNAAINLYLLAKNARSEIRGEATPQSKST